MAKVLICCRELLSEDGSIYLHIDYRLSGVMRRTMDEIFGEANLMNEIIWSYKSGGRAIKHFSRKHDTILFYRKSKSVYFNIKAAGVMRGSDRRNHMKRRADEDGRIYYAIRSNGKEYRYYEDAPVYPGDVWTDISHLQQRDPERTGYATQKPVKLLERLLLPVTQPGDLVCDLCCGSGTALAAAQGLGCRVAGVDMSPEAVLIARSRLHTDNLRVECPCTPRGTSLAGEYRPADGAMLLTDFRAEHPAFPKTEQPFDRLESWSAGYLREGEMVTLQHFQRSAKAPELPLMCLLPEHLPNLAVETVDAAGRKAVFLWRE